jgi:hypothetical protein
MRLMLMACMRRKWVSFGVKNFRYLFSPTLIVSLKELWKGATQIGN